MKKIFSKPCRVAVAIALVGIGAVACKSDDEASAPGESGAVAEQSVALSDGNEIKTRVAECNCGQLQVTVVGPDPKRISLCHCNLCQKQSGSAFAIQARFPKEQVTIKGESKVWKFPEDGVPPVDYRNCASEGAKYHFCATCGSTVYYSADADPARIGVKIGAFTDPTFPAPKISGFEAYRHPWAMNPGKLKMEHLD